MDANQKELFDAIWSMIEAGKYLQLALYLLILYLPLVVAWIVGSRKDSKLERVYKERLSDKDKEIERLAARVKALENVSLKTKRK
jgi:hypothetical protein